MSLVRQSFGACLTRAVISRKRCEKSAVNVRSCGTGISRGKSSRSSIEGGTMTQVAMPIDATDPVHQYRRQLRPSLAAQLEITPLEADDRTPEINSQLERLEQSLNERSKQISQEREMLEATAADYQRTLM